MCRLLLAMVLSAAALVSTVPGSAGQAFLAILPHARISASLLQVLWSSLLKSGACFATSFLLLIAISSSHRQAPPTAAQFPIPAHMAAVGEAATPHEYAQLIDAIDEEIKKPTFLDEGTDLGPLNGITAKSIALGSLGDGMVVNFPRAPIRGNGGGPMWIFVRTAVGYRNVIRTGGWGYTLIPSASAVPDIAFFWHMSAGETSISEFRYTDAAFAPVSVSPSECFGVDDPHPICARVLAAVWTIKPVAPTDLDTLWPLVKSLGVTRETFVHEAHAVDMGLVNDNAATVVGLGSCAVQSDCTISIYGHSLPLSGYWPLLQNVPGWGIANVSGRARPNFAMHFQGGFQTAFVVARRVSANAAELMRYTVIGSGRIGITQPGDQLHADGCERISAKAGAWPTQWDPAVFVLDPTPCGADAATGAAQENR